MGHPSVEFYIIKNVYSGDVPTWKIYYHVKDRTLNCIYYMIKTIQKLVDLKKLKFKNIIYLESDYFSPSSMQ